ncbi:MAG: AMP-binding protein [Polyangiaceae bacterium]
MTAALRIGAGDGLDVEAAAQEAGVSGTPALITAEGVLTFGALAGRVAHAAAALRAAGVQAGQRVAFRAVSRPDSVVVFLALARLGVAWLPIHARLGDAEAGEVLAAAEPVTRMSEADVTALAAGHASAATTADRPAAGVALDEAAPGADILALMATSGTTGHPKVAALPRAAFLASAAASADNLGWSGDDRWLCCMPLAHVGGLSIVTRCLIARRPVVLLPRFEVAPVLEAIERHRATMLSVVPTMLGALLAADHGSVLSRLRVVLVGGASCPDALLEECARRGVVALTTYGTTEACSQITAQRLPPFDAAPAVVPGSGRALAGVELAIFDDHGGPCAPGVIGRIHMRGPARMRGYLGQPPLADDAWFDTGDLGHLDETASLFVAARRTDLVISGGENVYPAEVERVVDACPGVRRSLVFGVPDERWGQVVAVALVVEPAGVSASAFAGALATRLAPHKRPRLACVVDALPETRAGKVDRSGALAALGARLGRL